MAGRNIKGITVEIGGDTTKLQTALKVELEDELERVAEPLLVLVCAAIWGAVSKAIAIKNEAA